MTSDGPAAELAGFTTSEQDSASALDRVFSTSRQRVSVTYFASLVHPAGAGRGGHHRRKVAYGGRSMVRTMRISVTSGICTYRLAR